VAEFYLIEKADDRTEVGLRGELDSQGVQEVETKFNATICPAGKNALVDFSGVTFLASLGIRMLVTAARTLAGKGARLVIYSAQPMVQESMVASSLDQLIPLAADAEAARKLLDG
jgi:anti-anti-sigma factor